MSDKDLWQVADVSTNANVQVEITLARRRNRCGGGIQRNKRGGSEIKISRAPMKPLLSHGNEILFPFDARRVRLQRRVNLFAWRTHRRRVEVVRAARGRAAVFDRFLSTAADPPRDVLNWKHNRRNKMRRKKNRTQVNSATTCY